VGPGPCQPEVNLVNADRIRGIPSAGCARGATLLELLVVLALVCLLAFLGWSRVDLGRPLDAVQGELRGCLERAQVRAQAQGRTVSVSLQSSCAAVPGQASHPAVPLALPLVLPRGVRWGLPPEGVPFPEGMKPPVRAHLTGEAHERVRVTPRHTAQASLWFLTDGKDALCLRLSDHGQLTLLRWRRPQRQWIRG
jgi:hypothetical protein